jgi:hypothetical protein
MQGDVDVASRATIQAFKRQGAPRLLIPSVSPVLYSVGRRHTRGARHHRTQQRPLVEPSECRSVAVRIGFVGERPNRGGVMSRVGGLLFLARRLPDKATRKPSSLRAVAGQRILSAHPAASPHSTSQVAGYQLA